MPAVSVVIPTYNRAAYLGQAIESVRQQTFQDWELVVVDDGSTDHTRTVVAQHLDPTQIRYLYQPHRERSTARNRGLEASSGPLVTFLDADDLWMPEKLVKQVAAMEQHPDIGLCYTLARRINGQGAALDAVRDVQVLAGWVLPHILRRNCIGTSSVMIRRSCLEQVGVFDEHLPVYGREDWDLWIRIARRYAVLPIREELTLHRVYEGNSSQEQNFQSGLAVLEKRCRDPGLLADAGLRREAAYAYLYLSSAAAPSLDLRRLTRARRLAWAARHHPPCLFSQMALVACSRCLLPKAMTEIVRTGYRQWVVAMSNAPERSDGRDGHWDTA
jgi:glycosyltransferase involved in cell wall biosynthesis